MYITIHQLLLKARSAALRRKKNVFQLGVKIYERLTRDRFFRKIIDGAILYILLISRECTCIYIQVSVMIEVSYSWE